MKHCGSGGVTCSAWKKLEIVLSFFFMGSVSMKLMDLSTTVYIFGACAKNNSASLSGATSIN
jgi:hypothetical protein